MHYSSGDDELNREGCISVDKLRTDEYLSLKIKPNMDFFFPPFGDFKVLFPFSLLTSLVIYIILVMLYLHFQASFKYSIVWRKWNKKYH